MAKMYYWLWELYENDNELHYILSIAVLIMAKMNDNTPKFPTDNHSHTREIIQWAFMPYERGGVMFNETGA